MMDALRFIGVSVLWLWVFWALYVFTMSVYRAQLNRRLRGINRLFASPLVLLAMLIDVLANVVVAPIVFLDLPREWLVTTRLKRYMGHESGWRKQAAEWLCNSVLDPFDPAGDHC